MTEQLVQPERQTPKHKETIPEMMTVSERELRRYTVIGGWELSSCELYIGFARLFYPFFVGYLIFRLKLKIKIKYPFLITSLLLAIVLCFPRIGGDNWIINGIYESVIILVIFPLIIMVGAGAKKNK